MPLFEGKVAIVTGAGRGIGRATALGLAKEGAAVVVNDLGCDRDGKGSSDAPSKEVAAEIATLGAKAVASAHPAHTEEGAREIVELAVSSFGHVDALVHAAGIARDGTISKLSGDDFRAVVDTQLAGSFFMMQAAARVMMKGSARRETPSGRIVLFTSVAGMRGNFGQSNTASADAGVFGLMRTAAIELQKNGIYVNALAPIAKTRLTEDLPMFESVESMTPDHVAPVALYLASDLAGEKTGHVLAVAGSQIYAFKLVQTSGRFKEGGAAWTPEEIASHFDSIMKI